MTVMVILVSEFFNWKYKHSVRVIALNLNYIIKGSKQKVIFFFNCENSILSKKVVK